ncbi:MAG TPA: hypothetical protein VIU62_19565 [Chloroflexota bacterium]
MAIPFPRRVLPVFAAVAVGLAGCGGALLVSSGATTTSQRASAVPVATPTAAPVAYVPPSAARTVEAVFALTPHPTPTATVAPTVTPVGARVSFAAVQQLLTGQVYANIVSVKSQEVPSLLRIKPGDPTNSYLYQKVTQPRPMVGVRMPKDGQPLTADEITTLQVWIEQGVSGQ